MCDRWRDSFEAFYADMGPRPSDHHSLDRYPHGDGNYEPGNVRWATSKEQANNWTTRNRRLTFGGQTMLLSEWAQQLGLTRESLRDRLDSGWSVEKALTTRAVRQRKRLEDGTFAALALTCFAARLGGQLGSQLKGGDAWDSILTISPITAQSLSTANWCSKMC